MAEVLQFVDSIQASPTIRLDLNDGTIFKWQKAGLNFSPPKLKRALVDNLLSDGALIPASAYENRTLVLRLFVVVASQDAMATALQALERELDREKNFIRFQRNGATNPVFFRTFRSPDYELDTSIEHGSGLPRAFIDLQIMAEPFAQGLAVAGTDITVNNDPAAGSNGLYADISSVPGNVACPAILTDKGSTNIGYVVCGVRRHGTPSNNTWFAQAEGMTLGATTAVAGSNDAAMSGAGNNYARTTPAGATNIKCLTTTIPSSSTSAPGINEARGVYRVFGVVRQNTGADVYKVNLQISNLSVANDTVQLSGNTNRQLVDLGLVSVPAGSASVPFAGLGGVALAVDGTQVDVYAQRVSGSGTLDWDYLVFVPADEELMIVNYSPSGSGTIGGGAGGVVFDGEADHIYQIVGGDLFSGSERQHSPASGMTFARAGDIPLLSPNQTNRLIIQCGRDPDNVNKSDTMTLRVTYFPRFLYIRT